MGKKKSDTAPDPTDVYRAVIGSVAEAEIKGAANLYTSMNGNMYSFRSGTGEMAFRLSDEDRNAFLERHPKSICIQHGCVMKGYVQIPESMVGDSKQLKQLFSSSHAFAKTLKAKPTTRKKAKSGAPKRALRKKK